jgi:hypothetical protein
VVTHRAKAGALLTGTEYEAADAHREVVVDHGSMGSTETFDFTAGSDHEGIQNDNLTVTLAGATAGETAFLTLVLTQDGSGAHTIDLPASVINGSDIEATWDLTASAVNILTLFSYDGGTIWYAFLAGTAAPSGGAATVIVKPADEAVINSAALQNDDDLKFTMLANTAYFITLVVFYDTTATGDFKYEITAPASPGTIRGYVVSCAPSGTPAASALQGALPSAVSVTSTNATGGFLRIEYAYQNGANAGDFQFRFAQNTATNDTGAIVRAGSSLSYKAE